MTKQIQEKWEESIKEIGFYNTFVKEFCNDHQDIRWLRGVFFDEREKLNTILTFLEIADSTIKEAEKCIREEMIKEIDLEKLAELEHEQWEEWSKNVAGNENISEDRYQRWCKLWIPYKDLSENAKDQDRVYARKVLDIINKIQSKDE